MAKEIREILARIPLEEYPEYKRGVKEVGDLLDFAERKGQFPSRVPETPRLPEDDGGWLKHWVTFYKDQFDLDLDENFRLVELPKKEEGYGILMFMPEGLTVEKVLDKIGETVFICDSAASLKKGIAHHRRYPWVSYAIRLRSVTGPEKDTLNKTPRELGDEGFMGVTFLEQLILEYWRLNTLGRPQEQTSTVCAGTRFDIRLPGTRKLESAVPRIVWDNNRRLVVTSHGIDQKMEVGGTRLVIATY